MTTTILYIACAAFATSFIIMTILYVMLNKQNKNVVCILENVRNNGLLNESNNAEPLSKCMCEISYDESGYIFVLKNTDGVEFGHSNRYNSRLNCMNSAMKMGKRYNLDVVEKRDNVKFGKYSILIEENDGKYIYMMLSTNGTIFTSRSSSNKEELLNDIDTLKSIDPADYMFVIN